MYINDKDFKEYMRADARMDSIYPMIKKGVPEEEILAYIDTLSDDEKEQIQKHPVIAAKEILSPISSIGNIIPIIENHHENWDGTGYPNKIAGDDIPIESQIILSQDNFKLFSICSKTLLSLRCILLQRVLSGAEGKCRHSHTHPGSGRDPRPPVRNSLRIRSRPESRGHPNICRKAL